MSFEQRITELGLILPVPPEPVANYVPFAQVGNLLFISGVVPICDGQIMYQGKLGREISKEQGYEAAKLALLNALSNVRLALYTLDHVKRIVKMTGYVASHEGFAEQPFVINGASDLLVNIFGDIGRHVRVAVGVAELPFGVPVELELVVEVSAL